MPNLLLVFIIAFLNWTPWTSETGRFQVLTPGELELKTDTVQTAIGELVYHYYFHQPQEEAPDNALYSISYCDYPEGAIHSDSLELLKDFFDATIESAASSVRGELFYETDINWQSYPGKLWRIHYNKEQAVIKTKAYLIGRRFYTISVISLRDKALNRFIDKFLDSFEPILEEG